VYVDDLLVAAKGLKFTEKMKRKLQGLFKMHNLDKEKHWVLKSFMITLKGLSAYHSSYIIKMLEKYQLKDCKPVAVPMDCGLVLSSVQCLEYRLDKW
jgi:hypothetical protein